MNEIAIVRGTTKNLKISITDMNGALYTLQDGEKLLFGVKKRTVDKDYVMLKRITEPEESDYIVGLEPEDTMNFPFGEYVYDVGLESGKDFYNIISASPFIVMPNVVKKGDGE